MTEPIQERRKGRWPNAPWRWEIILVAGLSMFVGAVGWVRVGGVADDAASAADDAQHAVERVHRIAISNRHFAVDLRDSAVEGCQRQNQVRTALRKRIKADIAALKDTRASDFPGIDPDRFARLIRHRRKELHEQLTSVPGTHCREAYPKPTRRETP